MVFENPYLLSNSKANSNNKPLLGNLFLFESDIVL